MSRQRYLAYIVYILVGMFFLGSIAYGQESRRAIYGYVVDSAGVGLKGVSVRLTSAKDTMTMASQSNGSYEFKGVRGAPVGLSFSMLGYQIYSKTVSIADYQSKILVPAVMMLPSSTLIKDVLVIKKIPIIYKQDTVIYNMDAFEFREHSLLEEGLKSLPGIHVTRDGTVFANGKPITSVRVDGKLFFGGDILTATKNLPTEFVKQIHVIDYYGAMAEQKGWRGNEAEKIINIVLKEDRKQISFGQLTAGGGTEDRFLGSAGLNTFNDGQEFSLVASMNNTNASIFSFGSPNGAGGRSRSLSDAMDFSEPADGLNTVRSVALNVSQNISPQTVFSGNYSFSRKNNTTLGNTLLNSTYVGNRISNREDYQTHSQDAFHKLALNYDRKFSNQDVLKVTPVFTYNKRYQGHNRQRQIRNNRITNSGEYQDTSYVKSPSMDVNVLYSKYFEKKGRKLVGTIAYTKSVYDKLEDVVDRYVSRDSSFSNPLVSSYLQEQYIQQKSGAGATKVSVSYIEPFFEHSLLEITYDYERSTMSALRRVEDKLKTAELGYFYYVDSLGVNYNYAFRSNRTGLNYQFKPNQKFHFNLGFAVQPITQSGGRAMDTLRYSISSVNLVPTANFKWRLSEETDWIMDYQGKNNQPNFTHIVPTRDISNSQHIVVGNPALKAEFSNKIGTTFRRSLSSRSQYFETNLAYSFISNKIVSSKKAIGNSPIQETTFLNASGYYDVKWFYLFNSPLANDYIQMDIFGNTDYYNHVSFINERKSITKQFVYSQSLQFRFSWSDCVESVLNANYTWNRAVYELPFKYKISAQSMLLSAGTRSFLSDHVTLGADVSQRFNDGYNSSFMNINPTIINAFIEFSFLPNKLAMIRLQGLDLLDQNKDMGTFSSYVGNEIYEGRNNRLGRYFMLTLNMRLQKIPKKKE